MKSLRTVLPFLGVIVALASVTGCSAESGNAGVEDPSTAATELKVTDKAEGHRAFAGPPHGGPDFLVIAALHEDIGLTAEQRTTIEGLVKKNRPEPREGREGREARPAPDATRAAALAAAVRSGNVESIKSFAPAPDAAKVAEFESTMKQKMNERAAASASSLKTLHDTLTAEQRNKLVDAIVAKRGEHAQRGERDGNGPREHGKPGMRGGPGEHGPFAGLLQGIELTQAQKDTLRAQFEANRPAKPSEADIAKMKAAHEAMKTSMDAKLQSFKGETFDASAFVTPPAGARGFGPHGPQDRAEGMKKMNEGLAGLVSVLDASQREQLAKNIEQGPKLDRGARFERGGAKKGVNL